MGLGASIRTGTPGTPDDAFSAASQVEVYERIGEIVTYALRLPVTASDGELSWLGDRRVAPGAQLGVYVPGTLGEVCLVRGPVTGHAARVAHGGAGSYVDVLGADASIRLDRNVRTRVWDSDARDSDAVSSIVAEAGFAADVRSTQAVHRADLRPLAQSDTDLRFVRRLARRNGFFAWLTTDAISGLDTFHFTPPPLGGAVAQTLIINQPDANTDTIDLSWDAERPTAIDALQLDLLTLENADAAGTASPSQALGSRRLRDLLSDAQTSRIVAPADDASELKARAEGAAVDAEWFVTANLDTTLAGVGSPVRSHSVVELRGMGAEHSGKYLVVGVRHLIDATGHRMTVELARNAWGA
jgi:phage protein D